MQMTQNQILELDKKLHKLKLYILKNSNCKVWISRKDNSVMLDIRILEDCKL